MRVQINSISMYTHGFINNLCGCPVVVASRCNDLVGISQADFMSDSAKSLIIVTFLYR